MFDQRIAIAPSLTLAVALGTVHLAAAGLVWSIPIPALGKAVFTFAIAVSLIFFMAQDALLHAAHSIVALEVRDGGGISLQTRRGEWIQCDLLDSTYVSQRLTIVNCRLWGRRLARHVILVPDNVDPRDFRRLRMWLRWKRGEGHVSAAAEES